jgi:hypothetical protein
LEYDETIVKQMLHLQHILRCVSPTFVTNFGPRSFGRTFEGGHLCFEQDMYVKLILLNYK